MRSSHAAYNSRDSCVTEAIVKGRGGSSRKGPAPYRLGVGGKTSSRHRNLRCPRSRPSHPPLGTYTFFGMITLPGLCLLSQPAVFVCYIEHLLPNRCVRYRFSEGASFPLSLSVENGTVWRRWCHAKTDPSQN